MGMVMEYSKFLTAIDQLRSKSTTLSKIYGKTSKIYQSKRTSLYCLVMDGGSISMKEFTVTDIINYCHSKSGAFSTLTLKSALECLDRHRTFTSIKGEGACILVSDELFSLFIFGDSVLIELTDIDDTVDRDELLVDWSAVHAGLRATDSEVAAVVGHRLMAQRVWELLCELYILHKMYYGHLEIIVGKRKSLSLTEKDLNADMPNIILAQDLLVVQPEKPIEGTSPLLERQKEFDIGAFDGFLLFDEACVEYILTQLFENFDLKVGKMNDIIEKFQKTLSAQSPEEEELTFLCKMKRLVEPFVIAVNALKQTSESVITNKSEAMKFTVGANVLGVENYFENSSLKELWERYFDKVSKISLKLFKIQEEVARTEQLITMAVDLRRNQILHVEIGLTFVNTTMALSGVIASIMGMNLKNGVEETAIVFWLFVFVIVIMYSCSVFSFVFMSKSANAVNQESI